MWRYCGRPTGGRKKFEMSLSSAFRSVYHWHGHALHIENMAWLPIKRNRPWKGLAATTGLKTGAYVCQRRTLVAEAPVVAEIVR